MERMKNKPTSRSIRPRREGGKENKRLGIVEPTEIDWVRLAAYIDGEGCISTAVAYSQPEKWKSESVYVNVSVHNTDPRLIDWILDRWGGRVFQTKHSNQKWTTSYGWRVTCQQAREVLEKCLPYFIIKREQAEIAIALMKTARRWGRAGMPDEVKALRWELRNKLSEAKGRNARMTRKEPRVIDYTARSKSKSGPVVLN